MRTSVRRRGSPAMVATTILLALVVAGALRFDHFASLANLTNLLGDYAYVGIAAVGATFVVLSGGIDLSVGSVVAFSAVAMSSLVNHGMHPLAAAALALLLGGAFGASMGWLICAFDLPPFMVTLVGMFAARAGCFVVSSESEAMVHPFLDRVARGYELSLGAGASLPFRSVVLMTVVLTGATIARATSFGRNVFAIGGDRRAAGMMGIPIMRTTVGLYALAGLCAALGGVVFAFYKRAGDPTAAPGLELSVIAAVVIGGTLLSGGVGSVVGTLAGVMILGVIRLLIDFEGDLNAAWTSVATGILLLGFVTLQKVVGVVGAGRERPATELTGGPDRSS